jgi:hypothetical protein
MNAPRFNYDRKPGTASDPSAQEYSKWIRVSHLDVPLLRDSTGSGRKKIFAIVTPPMPADLGCKTIRRILIFDNHPDSLRLVSSYRREDSHIHVSDPPRSTLMGVALLWILIVGLMMAMFWPLY